MANVRVFELAKRLGIGSNDLMALLQDMDITVTSPMAELEPGVDKMIQKKLGGQRATARRIAATTTSAEGDGDHARKGKIKRTSRKVQTKAPGPTEAAPDMGPTQQVSTVVPKRSTVRTVPHTPAAPTPAPSPAEEGPTPPEPTIGPMPPDQAARTTRVRPAATVRTVSATKAAGGVAEAPTEVPPAEEPTPAEPGPTVEEAVAPETAPAPEMEMPVEAPSPVAPTAEVPGMAQPTAPPVVMPEPVLERPEIVTLPPSGKKKKKKTQLREKVKQKLKETKEKPTEPVLPPVSLEPSERQLRRRERGPKEKVVEVPEVVTVDELAKQMSVKANEVILALMKDGMMVTKNHQLDMETVELIADKFGYNVRVSTSDVDLEEEYAAEERPEDLAPRAPVVTVMGHVDHGKTSLLDFIRKSRVAEGEAGGITQHIGAYNVETKQGRVVFLDTPGHEAFTAMRAHGAQVTDVVVLVVAADDGVKPQTIEAINHARAAEVPILVAINKMDKPEANVDRVKRELSEQNVLVEEWGGNVQAVPVSAKTGDGVPNLLELLGLESELLELRANPQRPARGVVIEAQLDRGRGAVATVLVQSGTLRAGDAFVAGMQYGRVRSMLNDLGKKVNEAGPSTPVEILGFQGVPEAGDPFLVLEDERKARQIAESRQRKRKQAAAPGPQRVTLDDLHKAIEEGQIEELKVVIKADVQGSAQALQEALQKLSTKEVKLVCIHGAVGGITESDVMLASASNALVIGFNVRPEPKARKLAEQEQVDVRMYRVIYDAIDDVRAAMAGLLKPETREIITGRAEVRDTFRISGVGTVAGCMVLSGEIGRNNRIRVIRDNVVVYEGGIHSLRRFKDDVRSVSAGMECGLGIENFNDVKVGDVLETFQVQEVERTL